MDNDIPGLRRATGHWPVGNDCATKVQLRSFEWPGM